MKPRLAVFFATLLVKFAIVGLVYGYIDNGDGTISAQSTGIMWEKSGSSSSMTWKEALVYCQGRSTAGWRDWRLPNRRELESLVDDSRASPAIYADFEEPGNKYWSGTTKYLFDGGSKWCVEYENGKSSYGSASGQSYVRCVRNEIVLPVAIILSKEPSPQGNVTFTIGGEGVSAYMYKLDGNAWSDEAAVSAPLELTGFGKGIHMISVLGRDAVGNWQNIFFPTSTSWTATGGGIVSVYSILLDN